MNITLSHNNWSNQMITHQQRLTKNWYQKQAHHRPKIHGIKCFSVCWEGFGKPSTTTLGQKLFYSLSSKKPLEILAQSTLYHNSTPPPHTPQVSHRSTNRRKGRKFTTLLPEENQYQGEKHKALINRSLY